MFAALLIIYTCLFSVLSWKQFETALIVFLISLPTYLIRFNVFGVTALPSTLLELSFGILFAVWTLKYLKSDWKNIVAFTKEHCIFTICLGLFFAASVSSIFISDMWKISLGQWRAYFLEPILFLVILIGRRVSFEKTSLGLMLSTFSVSITAILQKISPSFYPPSLFDDQLFGRVTSFFTSPNDIGLYLAPLIPLCAYVALTCHSRPRSQSRVNSGGNPGYRSPIAWLAFTLALIAILLSKSLGAYIALFTGLLVFLWLYNFKKTTLAIIVVALIGFFLPPVQSLIQSKEKSSSNRVVLWDYSWKFLNESPKNFVFGTGIRQFFRKIQKPYYDVKKMERLIYPHNILLNFWTEIGLIGMVSFAIFYIYTMLRAYKITGILTRAALISALIILFAHGLVDVPYFKNDLAFLFWAVGALAFLPHTNKA